MSDPSTATSTSARRDADAVSSLTGGDDHLHYSDFSHRWVAPPGTSQGAWEAALRAHMEQHKALVGEPPRAEARAALRQRRDREAAEQTRINRHRRTPGTRKKPPTPDP